MADLSVQVQSVTVALQLHLRWTPTRSTLLPTVSSPSKAASINHNWLGTLPQTPTSRPKKHPNFVLPDILHQHVRTYSSYYHYHHSPQPSRAVVWIPLLYHTRGCSPAVYDFERVVASAALGNNNPPSSSSQRGAHHASDKGAFLPRVLTEPDHSATTTWALLELASWCENG